MREKRKAFGGPPRVASCDAQRGYKFSKIDTSERRLDTIKMHGTTRADMYVYGGAVYEEGT